MMLDNLKAADWWVAFGAAISIIFFIDALDLHFYHTEITEDKIIRTDTTRDVGALTAIATATLSLTFAGAINKGC